MSAPKWAQALLRRLARPDRTDDVLGDLEEAHARRVSRRGAWRAYVLTSLEAIDMAFALIRQRLPGGGLRGSRMSALDLKLGLRMLGKYPGLTLVGGLAIALAIAVGAFFFEFANQVINPTVPLEDGDRIVAIRLWHLPSSGVEEQAMHDFVGWRGKLQSVNELGAYRDVDRNLVTADGNAQSVRIAEITASGFRLARVTPLLGRPLVESDEAVGAEPVIVIGERLWQTLFAGDPAVVGKTVRVGKSQSTVVGVMPESFAFPLHHQVWAPMRVAALEAKPRKGTMINVFGRLAPGVSLQQAQAELDILGKRAAADFPATHKSMQPQILPYTRSIFPFSWGVVTGFTFSGQAIVLLFLVLVCANVATLVFARTATRENEIVVRNALGASRGRIVSQLMAETLVLGAFGAAVGLSVARFGVRMAVNMFESNAAPLPFWVNDRLSPATVIYAVALTILAAAIAGAVPALKVTRGLADRLRQAAVGGANLEFGRLWTGLIVTQVALTVVFTGLTLDAQQDAARARALQLGFAAEEYLSVTLEMDRDAAAQEAAELPYTEAELTLFAAKFQELKQRLAAEPAVAGVTYAMTFPGTYHAWQRIEVDGASLPPRSGPGHIVQRANVGVDFFSALGAQIVAGRDFTTGDVDAGARKTLDEALRVAGQDYIGSRVAIVNETFAKQVFGGSNPIGRRIRYACTGENCGLDPGEVVPNDTRSGTEWLEIVGVVKDIAMTGDPDLLRRPIGGLYHPWAPGNTYWAGMAIHVRGDVNKFIPKLRAVVTAVDPSLRIDEVLTLDAVHDASMRAYDLAFRVALVASTIVLMLSVAGIYSIMSFTVSRRTREIGIRAALGADPRRIVLQTFSRGLVQVGLGVFVGLCGMIALTGGLKAIALIPPAIILSVCALACVVPTRRALSIQPTDALRS